MAEGGIIASEAVAPPEAAARPATRAGLVELAGALDPLILRWGRCPEERGGHEDLFLPSIPPRVIGRPAHPLAC